MMRRALLLVAVVALSLGSGRAVHSARVSSDDLRTLRVRDTVLTLEWRAGVALVEAAPLARIVQAQWRSDASGRHEFVFGDLRAEFHVGLPFTRIQGEVHSLATAPRLRGTSMWIPLHAVSEWLPRYDASFGFDRRTGVLRVPAITKPVVVSVPVVAPAPTPAKPAAQPRARRVIIDPGHGGVDPGMRGRLPNGRIVYEKDIALGVSKQLSAILAKEGVEVHLTRDRDTLIALHERGPIANRLRGDLFLSVHVNSANPATPRASSARGFETYFLAEARTEDARRVQQMENEVVRFETDHETSAADPMGFIINDMAQNEHLRESLELAAAIQAGLAPRHPGPNRGVKQAAFSVLVRAFMPAVLIEIGFASNPIEAAWLSSVAGQRTLAQGIADATLAYLEAYERRVGGGGQ